MADNGSRVELVGAREAFADMGRWADQLAPAVDKGTRDLADEIAGKAAAAAPVLTGTFAGSVAVVDLDAGDGGPGWGVSIGDGVPYASWLEFGGSRGRPYIPEGRYLYPAATDAAGEFEAQAADIADDTASRFAWHKAT